MGASAPPTITLRPSGIRLSPSVNGISAMALEKTIRTVFWQDGAVVLIDQRALPLVERYVTCTDYRQVIAAIRDLTIRGAPAIGVAAAMGIALGMLSVETATPAAFRDAFEEICGQFGAARPTARNLFWAIERIRRRLDAALSALPVSLALPDSDPFGHLRKLLVAEAVRIGEEDIVANCRLGQHGCGLIPDGARILTHCNAGALATAGYGTALGVIRAAAEEGKKIRVYVDETRPVLQGARLTTWELMREGIPCTLITDNMAGFLMKKGEVDLVIVGADRIAANGDAANKIGTYGLAVLARAHGIPFYIAAPLSTIDPALPDGEAIPIEERTPDEVTHIAGIRTAPEGIAVWNPAFDVTPHELITAIITETGMIRPPFSEGIGRACSAQSPSDLLA
jgi:methylthioribose-1-phosphate isomerase